MEEEASNKFFAYAIVVSLIISILAIIYVAWEFGKDISDVQGVSDSKTQVLGEYTDQGTTAHLE